MSVDALAARLDALIEAPDELERARELYAPELDFTRAVAKLSALYSSLVPA